MTTRTPIPRDLAHELRTPLAAVVTSLDLIASGEVNLDPSEVTEIIQAAKADAENLLAIVEEARAPVPSGGRQARAVVVGEIVRRVLERFPSVKARTYLRIDSSVTAQIDGSGLDQIVTNLIQNVARYAPEGDVELRVRQEREWAILEVADEGPGIESGDAVFEPQEGGSDRGMHVGLSISRRIAREAGGDLSLAEAIRSGATLRLELPAGEPADRSTSLMAVAPRARVLVELAGALGQLSLSRVEAGLSRIAHDLLGATGTAILVKAGDELRRVGDRKPVVGADHPLLGTVGADESERVVELEEEWIDQLTGSDRGLIVRLEAGLDQEGCLVLGLPAGRTIEPGDEVLEALATVAGLAVARSTLRSDLVTERGLRSSVMEALPIAISIFTGDPPRLVDMNEAERRLLGLGEDGERPSTLARSQEVFDVRFADGTPLSVETAPITQAIRTGEPSGPFYLRLRRSDGSEVVTRTYCAPFFDAEGRVAGAVVTSEPVDESEIP